MVANNSPMYSEGYVKMKIDIGSITTTAKFWVLENLCTGIILGLDWLRSDAHKACIDFDTSVFSISANGKKSSISLLQINTNQHYPVRTCDTFTLNSMEERIIEIKIPDLPNCGTAHFTPTPRFLYHDSILMPHALINVKNYKALMTITNISNQPRIISKNTPIGIIEIESPHSTLATSPVFLNFPIYDVKTKKPFPYVLSTDASKFGIAGALKQQTPEGLKAIVYISRTLNAAERNYSTFERECLGIVWSVTKLRDYLADESFVIETDQQPARNIHLNRTSTNRRVNNWKLQLQDYDIIEIKYKSGTKNCDADYMSRHPLINNEEINDDLDGVCAVMTRSKTKQQNITAQDSSSTTSSSITSPKVFHSKHLSSLDPDRLKSEQNNDAEIQEIIHEFTDKPDDRYSIVNGILNIQFKNGKYVPVIPITLRNEILHSFHEHPTAGHFGRDKTWYRLKDRCFWPTMRQDVIHYIQSCSACAQHNI
ncbi:unnamed protein product [Didymodactylos carnosus]|uniref:Uncharacterized protein n=1 Tax=Didymodactylos carnosus TaxID=1234261 RepID=A0A814GAM4_9BILA|nr:unnamed protein product [Didymodactylos carnosus]CAF3766031.1 unnamed protein product [Didymodactylos carnosus]